MGLAIPQVVSKSTTSGSGAQIIDGSLKFDAGKSEHLKRTPGSTGNRRAWTWSAWVKRTVYGADKFIFSAGSDASNQHYLRFKSNNTLEATEKISDSTQSSLITNAVHRDTEWYHLVYVFDSTQSTSSDRVCLYVNGVKQTSLSTNTYPSQNHQSYINNTSAHYIGSSPIPSAYYDGSISQVYLIDGQALTSDSFGFTDPLTNTWKPKKYTRGVFEELDKFNTYTWGETQNQLRYQGIKFPSSAGGTVAWKATGSSNTGLNLYTSTDNSTWTRRLTNQTVDSTNGLVYESSDQYVILVNGTDTNWSNQLQLFSDVNGATIHYSNATYPGNGSPTMSWSGPGYTDGTIASYNSFYLPMDGNSSIGQDQSGNGNDWTPVNFGGSVELDSPTVSGARPILNTTQGGTQAGVGVFGSRENVGYAVTVYNDGGGNKYYIDGVKQDTVTGLIRGATYTFDTSDSTVSSHPFRFSATSNGSHGGGSEYTNGVAAITGSATTITVPHDAPNTLYYYCTSHSGMGADITGITTNEKLADQYASQCTLALPLVGNDKDVCASIACTARNKTATNSSVTASSTQSNFYNGSHHWSANSDTLQYAQQGDELVFGTNDFTIECWLYDDNGHNGGGSGRCYIFDNRIGGSVVGDPPTLVGYIDSHNEFNFYDGDGDITHTVPSTVGKWWHYAVTREGTTTRMFIDGILRGSSTSSTNFTNNGIGVGRATDGGYGFAGYIQDFRVYKGIAKYTSDFVVPATSPDIFPDTPSGVSGGSKLAKITDGAVSGFESNSDYLSVAASNDFVFDGDHTIELFVYHNSLSDDSVPWSTGGSGQPDQLYINTIGEFYYGYGQTGAINSPSGTIVTGKWQHIAVSKQGSNLRMFVDGKIVASSTNHSSSIGRSSNNARIGNRIDGGNAVRGFISNLRVVKGTALYTSNFTPPTEPLTNVTNTKLLCCQSNAQAGAAVTSPNMGGVNDGREWSHFTSASGGFNSSYPKYFLFDGQTPADSNRAQAASNDVPINIDFSPAITVSSTISLWSGKSSTRYQINNSGSYTTYSDAVGSYKDISHSGSLSNIKILHGSAGQAAGISAIKIDGTQLKDPASVVGDTAATNFNPFNTDINTVRGQETGYCTLNPLDSKSATITENNLKAQVDSDGANFVRGTIAVSSGKWYFEFTTAGSNNMMLGALDVTSAGNWGTGDAFYYYGNGGALYGESSGKASSWGGSTLAVGDTLGVALDMDNGTIVFYKNGILIGTAWTGMTGRTVAPAIGTGGGSGSITRCNFGQKPFKFGPPDGFQPLNAANTRPVKVISRPDQYVGVSTWSGDNVDGREIDMGMAPDLIWVKTRNQTNWHWLTDTVRGAPNKLYANSTNAEDTTPIYGQADSFTYKGWIAGGGTDGSNPLSDSNQTGTNYVSWGWKAGGNKNTFNVDDVGYASAAAAGLDGGDLTVTGASVGTKQGFSIIKWESIDWAGNANNRQVPHGLTQSPDFIVTKGMENAAGWYTYHKDLHATDPNDYYLTLNTTDAVSNLADSWGPNKPDATTFGDRVLGWTGGQDVIAYLWHDVPGLQKFGKFIGNANADGPYVELGFKPAVVWIKNSTDSGSSDNWACFDNVREGYNVDNDPLYLNKVNAEATTDMIDLLSNGFKIRGTFSSVNGSGDNMIYCAWAAAPSIDLYGGGANAR